MRFQQTFRWSAGKHLFTNPNRLVKRGNEDDSELIEVSFNWKETQQNSASKIFSLFQFVKYIVYYD